MKDLLTKATQQTIENFTNIDTETLNHVTIEATCGFDGSGRHSKHRTSKSDSDSIIYGGVRIYKISGCNDTVIYEEESLNSDTEIPWFLVPGQEKRDLVKDIAQRMEEEAKDCCKKNLKITINGKTISVKVVIKLTQADGKVIKTVTGLGGAWCTMCKSTKAQIHDIKLVEKRFKINRDMETITDTYNELIDKGTFHNASTNVRQGITQKPILTDFLQPISCLPVLHAKINSLKFWENIAYSFNARGSFENNTPIRGPGLKKTDDQKLAIDASKYEFRDRAKQLLNLPLDMPDPSGAGGNTGTYFSLG